MSSSVDKTKAVIRLIESTTSVASTFKAFTSTKSPSSGPPPQPPSAITIYKVGNILYDTKLLYQSVEDEKQTKSQQYHNYENLSKAFYQLLSTLDKNHLSSVIFHDINSAFISIIRNGFRVKVAPALKLSESDTLLRQCSDACNSLRGIHDAIITTASSNKESSIAQCAFDISLCEELAYLYDMLSEDYNENTVVVSSENNDDVSIATMKECILSLLSSLLLYGLIYPLSQQCKQPKSYNENDINEDHALQKIMNVLHNISEQSTSSSVCLGDLLKWQKRQRCNHHTPISDAVSNNFSNEVQTQKEYLILMLKNSITQSNEQKNLHLQQKRIDYDEKNDQANQKSKNQKQTLSLLERHINQIRSVFPQLGEGYVEAALACYNNDIEATTMALVEGASDPSKLHPRLSSLDKSLPARRKESKSRYNAPGRKKGDDGNDDKIDKEDEEAREIQKAKLREMVIQEEEEAYRLGVAMAMDDMEYNDDYDDQYDGIGDDGGAAGVTGGADSGLYDIDFEAVKAYNKFTKEMESDRLYWEESRNMNRSQNFKGSKKKDIDNDDDESAEQKDINKKYRGPDKGKGGRTIGPDGKYLPFPKSRKKGNKSQPVVSNSDEKKGIDGKTNDNMSKIQKRRKTDNKAKIGNHHRKDRALKKTAG